MAKMALNHHNSHIEFDPLNRMISFGNQDFRVYLDSTLVEANWEGETCEIIIWNICLSFTNEYDQDPSTYKFYGWKGEIVKPKEKTYMSDRLHELYSKILNGVIVIDSQSMNGDNWERYEELAMPVLENAWPAQTKSALDKIRIHGKS